MRRLLIIHLLSMPFITNAQKYSLGDLSVAGDKAMLSLVGDDIFSHSKFDINAAYSYADRNGEEVWAYVKDHSATKYKPRKIIVQYSVDYPFDKCPIQNHVSGRITLEFNDKLELTNTPDIRFIPDFMIANEKCKYLTRDEALAILKKEKFKGKEIPDIVQDGSTTTFKGKAQLMWSFRYTIYNDTVVKDENGSNSKRREEHLVSVDAATGAIASDITLPNISIDDAIKMREKQDKEKEQKR